MLKRYAAISLVSLVAAFAFMEGYTRLFRAGDFHPPSWLAENKYPFAVSHFGGTLLKLGPRRVSPSDPRLEKLVFPINSLGFRGRDVTVAKPPGTFRIAVCGGSSVFDVTANELDDWPSQLERTLRERGLKVEVLNLGVPGMPAYDCALRMATEIGRLRPDVALISTIWNDMAYFHTRTALYRIPRRMRSSSMLHYYNFLDELLSEHSYFYSEARYNLLLRSLRKESQGPLPLEDGDPQPLNGPTPEALETYRQSLMLFVDASRNAGAKPVLMAEPTLVGDSTPEAARAWIGREFSDHFTYEGLAGSFRAAKLVLRSVGKEKQAPVLDFGPDLDGNENYFTDQVHLRPEGRARLVQLLADRMARLLR